MIVQPDLERGVGGRGTTAPRTPCAAREASHERLHLGVGAQSGIEIYQYGSVGRVQIEDAADA